MSNNTDPNANAEHVANLIRGRAFQANYNALHSTIQALLDAAGQGGMPAQDGMALVHAAIVALDQCLTRTAVEHLGKTPEAVDHEKAKHRRLGDTIYAQTWGPRLSSKTGGLVVGKAQTGILGTDGRPLLS